MIPLTGKFRSICNMAVARGRLIRKLTDDPIAAADAPTALALIDSQSPVTPSGIISIAIGGKGAACRPDGFIFEIPAEFRYLRSGDVLRFDLGRERFRVLFRKNSGQNSLLVTERCENYCLMCSQPPRDIDDSWVLDDLFETVSLLDDDTTEIGFTGGEPTLCGDRFIALLRHCKSRLPTTAVHVLSNGRKFSNASYAEKWASVGHADLMVGIPVYSDLSSKHDYVVQAEGAFDETIRGILNLKRLGQRFEIRVVLHKQTYERLPQLANFIARNLLFVDHVAFMGLEITGFTRANLSTLWIDPAEYQAELYRAVTLLDDFGVRTSIYNLQLCLLDRRLWRFAVRSISDWKREYFSACDGCVAQPVCGGMFSSARYRQSDRIAPIRDIHQLADAGLLLPFRST